MSPVSFDPLNSSIFPTAESSGLALASQAAGPNAGFGADVGLGVLSPTGWAPGAGLALPPVAAPLDPVETSPEPGSAFGAVSAGLLLNLPDAKPEDVSPASGPDDLTGTASAAPLVLALQSVGAAESTKVFNDQLESSDSLNPTRLGRYKDDFLLNPPEAGQLQLNLESWAFDTYLQVLDAATGQVILENDDYGDSTDSQVIFDVAAGAQLIVRVTSFAPQAMGEYSLTAYLHAGGANGPTAGDSFSVVSGYGLVDAAAAVTEALGGASFEALPDLAGQQWNNAMVNAPDVWAQGFTGQGITVAVIDSGVDIYHEDLIDNVWVNSDEFAGDGLDNDGNGYVDDVYGWNFGVGQNNGDVTPGTSSFGQDHGTHVAGTIAAKYNNIGMTGVAPDAKIMALRMGDVVDSQFTNAGSLAQAITYAVDNGARVINMSLGWTDSVDLRDALAYAAAKNVITVSAAGNQGLLSPTSVPGKYATNYGLTVGAVDIDQDIATFSNLAGTNSKMQYVVAPGVDVYSTLPGNSYGFKQGTSMASPHVAGVVALMLSANPDLTHDQVRAILAETGMTLGSLATAPAASAASGSAVIGAEGSAEPGRSAPRSDRDAAGAGVVLTDLEWAPSIATGGSSKSWGKFSTGEPRALAPKANPAEAGDAVDLTDLLAASADFEKLAWADWAATLETAFEPAWDGLGDLFPLEQDWVAQEVTEFRVA